ncbi:MAG: Fe-S protein assembly co-chaperone HscB [Burkholderiaceae bacterium]|nr:Fe-S protein assembly co-chaperone HscB [Burkholderiaceae bacterium]
MKPILPKTHFELFGLPERFSLDRSALELAFRKVQGAVHPDRFAAASDGERRVAMQLATNANEALRTLRDPASRAGYLCELHGAEIGLQSNTAMPQSFLVSQMQWRERLEESAGQGGAAALERLRADIAAERDGLLERLADALDNQRDFTAAAGLVRQLAFYDRLGSEIDAAEDRILGH